MVERPRNYIRVINTPPGGAPESIRQEWIEMYLPLAREIALAAREIIGEDAELLPDDSEFLKDTLACDIETGLVNTANAGGYVVNALEAIEMLEKKGTKGGNQAAQYWRQKLTKLYGGCGGVQLFFDRSICELMRKREE